MDNKDKEPEEEEEAKRAVVLGPSPQVWRRSSLYLPVPYSLPPASGVEQVQRHERQRRAAGLGAVSRTVLLGNLVLQQGLGAAAGCSRRGVQQGERRAAGAAGAWSSGGGGVQQVQQGRAATAGCSRGLERGGVGQRRRDFVQWRRA
ncbi:hypothetical protein BRADI_1g30500v3 [Brachypodium distachyon]|uniref:Uncharacterized protein n=1 Tax=Brachypodium distachyon TaxID=15368 RepID=A0A2K2DM40_BRADI|nr:hypothetical protein BRADI_1g30500v3 [Brachypodium distachyon]